MKAKAIFWLVLLIIIGSYSSAGAIPVLPDDPLIQNLPDVQFWAIDDPVNSNDDSVEIRISSFNLPESYVLQYKYGLNNWTTLTNNSPFEITDVGLEKELVYLRIALSADPDNVNDTSGRLQFNSYEATYYGIDAYSTLIVNWDEGGSYYTEFTFPTVGNNDNPGPVPIPATAWIFGAGLVGIVGIRRKLKS